MLSSFISSPWAESTVFFLLIPAASIHQRLVAPPFLWPQQQLIGLPALPSRGTSPQSLKIGDTLSSHFAVLSAVNFQGPLSPGQWGHYWDLILGQITNLRFPCLRDGSSDTISAMKNCQRRQENCSKCFKWGLVQETGYENCWEDERSKNEMSFCIRAWDMFLDSWNNGT